MITFNNLEIHDLCGIAEKEAKLLIGKSVSKIFCSEYSLILTFEDETELTISSELYGLEIQLDKKD